MTSSRGYWLKQTKESPLFADLIWSRPERTTLAGKLLIVGGNSHGFAAPAEAYSEAVKAGIGVCRILLPDSLTKIVGRILENGEYAPSTPSGSLARTALDILLELSEWADSTMMAGDFGRNSETVILLEKFVTKFSGQAILTKDSIDYFLSTPNTLLQRPKTLLVVSFAQLQKLASNIHFNQPFTYDMDFLRLIDLLHDFSLIVKSSVIVNHSGFIFVANNGQVSSTKINDNKAHWRVSTAAHAAVWLLQNPSKVFEALTSSLL